MRPSVPRNDNKREKNKDYVYSIILRNAPIGEIHSGIAEKAINIAENATTRDFITRKIGDNLHWIILSSKEKEKIKLKLNPKKEQDYEMLVFFAEGNGEIDMIRKSFNSKDTTINLLEQNAYK